MRPFVECQATGADTTRMWIERRANVGSRWLVLLWFVLALPAVGVAVDPTSVNAHAALRKDGAVPCGARRALCLDLEHAGTAYGPAVQVFPAAGRGSERGAGRTLSTADREELLRGRARPASSRRQAAGYRLTPYVEHEVVRRYDDGSGGTRGLTDEPIRVRDAGIALTAQF